MSVNFDCKKCIHFYVCIFKDEATEEIKLYNSRIGENKTFKLNLNCKHYANISIPKDVIL